VAEKLEVSGLKYSQSHQNDPLGALVASEVISIISEVLRVDPALIIEKSTLDLFLKTLEDFIK